jgi:hypothetical protein
MTGDWARSFSLFCHPSDSKSVDTVFEHEELIIGFKVDYSISIRQAIQNPIREKLLSEVKHEKVNRQ